MCRSNEVSGNMGHGDVFGHTRYTDVGLPSGNSLVPQWLTHARLQSVNWASVWNEISAVASVGFSLVHTIRQALCSEKANYLVLLFVSFVRGYVARNLRVWPCRCFSLQRWPSFVRETWFSPRNSLIWEDIRFFGVEVEHGDEGGLNEHVSWLTAVLMWPGRNRT